MSFGRTYWILIDMGLSLSLSLLLDVCQLQSWQTARHSLNCLRFVYLLDDPFSIFLYVVPLAFPNVRLVWPAGLAVTVMQSSTCVWVCVSPKSFFCNCRRVFEFTQHFARLLWHFCMNIKYTWDISLGSAHRGKHAGIIMLITLRLRGNYFIFWEI